jgi:hypothetical protein
MCMCGHCSTGVFAHFGYVQVDSFGRVLENERQRHSALILGLEFVLNTPGALGHRDEIMSWEWALKFPTLKLWVGFCPPQFLKVENLSAHSHLRFPSSRICVPVRGSANHEFQTENLCWAPLASILQDPIRAVDLDIPKAQWTVEGGKTNVYVFVMFWMVGSLRFPPRCPGVPQSDSAEQDMSKRGLKLEVRLF